MTPVLTDLNYSNNNINVRSRRTVGFLVIINSLIVDLPARLAVAAASAVFNNIVVRRQSNY